MVTPFDGPCPQSSSPSRIYTLAHDGQYEMYEISRPTTTIIPANNNGRDFHCTNGTSLLLLSMGPPAHETPLNLGTEASRKRPLGPSLSAIGR